MAISPARSGSTTSLASQMVDELRPFLAHQRHKWAAQCQSFGLSMTHFQVLAILDIEGPTAMSRLADALGVGFSNVTGIVGRLEERGVVARVHDKDDRRIVLAQLTDAGGEMLREVEEIRFSHLQQLFETMTRDEQRSVLSAIKTMTAAHARLHVELGEEHAHDRGRNAHDRGRNAHEHGPKGQA